MLDRSSKVDDAFARLGIGLPEPDGPPDDGYVPPADYPDNFDAVSVAPTPAMKHESAHPVSSWDRARLDGCWSSAQIDPPVSGRVT